MLREFVIIGTFALTATGECVQATGLVAGDHFTVITPAAVGDAYARRVLNEAERFRKTFIAEWLDAPPTAAVQTVISVSFSTSINRGRTLARDREDQHYHNVFIKGTPELAAGPLLRHELVHTVLATAYFRRLPAWVEEGIACRYDAPEWRSRRQSQAFAPSVAKLFTADELAAEDYAAAESLVAFLLTRGSQRTLVRFAAESRRVGYDRALGSHYRLDNQAALERAWRAATEGKR